MSQSDIVSTNEQTLILESIGQCDVKHIMTLPIKSIRCQTNNSPKVVPFKENISFRFVVLWQIQNGME
jgi:hypothetical protein